MLIQINTDNHIEGKEKLVDYFTSMLESDLDRFKEHITRLEVHLSDENGGKEGINDKRCLIEARLKGLQPIAVTEKANTLHLAVSGATDKITKSIESELGYLNR